MPSASRLPPPSFSASAVNKGPTFMPDKATAVREMYRVLVPGGRIALNVWRALQENPEAAAALVDVLGRHVSHEAATAGPRPRSPSVIPRSSRHWVVGAGFCDVVVRPTVKIVRAPSVEAFIRRHVAGLPAVSPLVAQVDDHVRTALLQDVTAALRPYITAEGLVLPTPPHCHRAYITHRKRMAMEQGGGHTRRMTLPNIPCS